jgi:hypothetical protein
MAFKEWYLLYGGRGKDAIRIATKKGKAMSKENIKATFGKMDDRWTARVESGQSEEPKVGAQVVIVKKDGDSKNITLTSLVGEKPIGEEGKRITFWDFFEGWSQSEEVVDDEPF